MSATETAGTPGDALPGPPDSDPGPLGDLPRLSGREVRLGERLAAGRGFGEALARAAEPLGLLLDATQIEARWWPSALKRTGLVVQLSWPRLATRVALGLETPLAHSLVDRLLGFERLAVEELLPLTPVEWGVMTFLAARFLSGLRERPGPLGPWDLTIDRVGPDPLEVRGLGPIVSLRVPGTVGTTQGAVWFWLPETLVVRWLSTGDLAPRAVVAPHEPRYGGLSAWWRAEAGTITLGRGLTSVRAGGILPLGETQLFGPPAELRGRLDLSISLSGSPVQLSIPVEPVPYSGGARLSLSDIVQRRNRPREAISVSPAPEPSKSPNAAGLAPADVPVTLVVELGRVNIPLARLADMRPGDVVELGRHSREPVELTSNGRLVARGELVQIDTELGVRVTNVFL